MWTLLNRIERIMPGKNEEKMRRLAALSASSHKNRDIVERQNRYLFAKQVRRAHAFVWLTQEI
ncbi:hypothetical protein P3T43_005395 [Paraburkholderia sp. GAS41]|jgi:hypothetical protein|uniref:hypothetical protein n=1 Tax=Paraburkholderia sp. GAS41 TaxID=3035134 RepID=UPI003D1C13D8